MKINDILNCFNKALSQLRETNNLVGGLSFVGYSSWEKKIGAVKRAWTVISLIRAEQEPVELIKEEYTTVMKTGMEQELIEETQRRALKKFILFWNENLQSLIDNSYGTS